MTIAEPMAPHKILYGRITFAMGAASGGTATYFFGPWALFIEAILILIFVVLAFRKV